MSTKVKGRRPRDSARDEFTSVLQDGKLKQQCNHCSQVIVNHTATLRNHLLRKHPMFEAATGASANVTAGLHEKATESSSLSVKSMNSLQNRHPERPLTAMAAEPAVAIAIAASSATTAAVVAATEQIPMKAINPSAIEESRTNSSSESGSESASEEKEEEENEEEEEDGEGEDGNEEVAHQENKGELSAADAISVNPSNVETQHQEVTHGRPLDNASIAATASCSNGHDDMELCTNEEANAPKAQQKRITNTGDGTTLAQLKMSPSGHEEGPLMNQPPNCLRTGKKRKHSDVVFSDAKTRRLVNVDEFARINKEMHEYDERRESIIKRSRDILKNSKQAIFALHREGTHDASRLLTSATGLIPELVALTQGDQSLRNGILSSALEEYAEARCFQHYLDHGTLLSMTEMALVNKEEYLGGVIDFTGEITRLAVMKAAKRDVQAVEQCREIVEAISGELIQFDFRNGALRKKYDSLKYNLKKLEHTIYELSLISSSGLTVNASSTQLTADADDQQQLD